jgi:hypothetical protein
MATSEDFEISPGKSIGDLGKEAVWFAVHSVLAVVFMVATILVMGLSIHDQGAPPALELGTVLCFLVPMFAGFIIAKLGHNQIARYVWISGLLLFSAVCVWVLDLPTGNGLCEGCGAIDKLWRTFFSISNGSGLMSGQGIMVGAWAPLSLVAYAVGASFGLDKE